MNFPKIILHLFYHFRLTVNYFIRCKYIFWSLRNHVWLNTWTFFFGGGGGVVSDYIICILLYTYFTKTGCPATCIIFCRTQRSELHNADVHKVKCQKWLGPVICFALHLRENLEINFSPTWPWHLTEHFTCSIFVLSLFTFLSEKSSDHHKQRYINKLIYSCHKSWLSRFVFGCYRIIHKLVFLYKHDMWY